HRKHSNPLRWSFRSRRPAIGEQCGTHPVAFDPSRLTGFCSAVQSMRCLWPQNRTLLLSGSELWTPGAWPAPNGLRAIVPGVSVDTEICRTGGLSAVGKSTTAPLLTKELAATQVTVPPYLADVRARLDDGGLMTRLHFW